MIFTGDPLTPSSLTKEATAQNYFPEWVIGSNVLVDIALFGRTYDQQQWQHAFGLALTPARTNQDARESYNLYKWEYGKPPPNNTYGVIIVDPSALFTGLQLAGPNLTPETFAAGMFRAPVAGGTPLSPTISRGHHGLWPGTDWGGTDDTGHPLVEPERDGRGRGRQGRQGPLRVHADGQALHARQDADHGPGPLRDPRRRSRSSRRSRRSTHRRTTRHRRSRPTGHGTHATARAEQLAEAAPLRTVRGDRHRRRASVVAALRASSDGGGESPDAPGTWEPANGPVVFSAANKELGRLGTELRHVARHRRGPAHVRTAVRGAVHRRQRWRDRAGRHRATRSRSRCTRPSPTSSSRRSSSSPARTSRCNAELETVQQYVDFFEAHYETYGRHVKIVPVKASGAPDDEAAARPTRSRSRPRSRRSRRGVVRARPPPTPTSSRPAACMCIGDCLLAATNQYVKDSKNHVWLTFPSIEQLGEHWSQFLDPRARRPQRRSSPATRACTKQQAGLRRGPLRRELRRASTRPGAAFVKQLRRTRRAARRRRSPTSSTSRRPRRTRAT